MSEKENNRLVLWGIIIIVLGAALLCGYAVFARNNRKDEDKKEEVKVISVDYSKIAGAYVSKDAILPEDGKKGEDGEVIFDYHRLTINVDGTAKYEHQVSNAGSADAQGNLYVGKDKLYLVNKDCQKMVIVGNSCSWPNCDPAMEFDYKDGKITIDDYVEFIKKKKLKLLFFDFK